MDIKEKIEHAFSAIKPPKPNEWLHHECFDEDDLKLLRKYDDWKSIPPKVIEDSFLSLSTTSSKAFSFVLPAYLTWIISNFETSPDSPVINATIFCLSPIRKQKLDSFALSHYDELNHDQGLMIIHWLEYMLKEAAHVIDLKIAKEALRYWQAQLPATRQPKK